MKSDSPSESNPKSSSSDSILASGVETGFESAFVAGFLVLLFCLDLDWTSTNASGSRSSLLSTDFRDFELLFFGIAPIDSSTSGLAFLLHPVSFKSKEALLIPVLDCGRKSGLSAVGFSTRFLMVFFTGADSFPFSISLSNPVRLPVPIPYCFRDFDISSSPSVS